MHEELAALVADYADRGAGDDAPTYRLLAHAIAGRKDLLDVVASAPPGRQHPNNLFAAVRFLLFEGRRHRLADVYRRISTGKPEEVKEARSAVVAAFADFVHAYRTDIVAAMGFRGVQTNEPARSAHIAAGLAHVQDRRGPLAVLDVGTSAGLNLMVDRCRISFGAVAIGPVDSRLHLYCESVGADPPVGGSPLDIAWRHGLDRDPVDLADEPSRRWLRSCVWIDQPDRGARLDQAIELARVHPIDIAVGDAVVDLPALIARVPEHLHLVVLTTWVAYYFDEGQRAGFERVLARAGRPVSWLSLEYPKVVPGIPRPAGTPSGEITPSVLGLVTFDDTGHDHREFLGWAHHHGTWLDWHDQTGDGSTGSLQRPPGD